MNKYFYHVWNPNDSFEGFMDQILADPDGFHFYDGSNEFEIGEWRLNPYWEDQGHPDPIPLKYNKILELYEQRPDVKSRVVSHWGYHSKVDPINFPRCGEEFYNIFDKEYVSPLFFLLKTLGDDTNCHKGLTEHETEVVTSLGFPTIEQSMSIKPTQLFNFPMNRPHPHRINAFHAMIELGLVDEGYLGFCADNQAWRTFTEIMIDHIGLDRGKEYFEPILNIMDKLFRKSAELGEVYSSEQSQSNPSTPHLNIPTRSSFTSVVDIVSESTSSKVHFFTEKTFKSLMWGRPFVILGSPNQNKVFADMGFEPYSDIFDLSGDENYYQTVDHHDNGYSMNIARGQIDAYKKVLKPLTQIDPAEYCKIKSQAMPTVKHNHNVMVKKIFSDDIIPWHIFSDPEFEEHTNSHYSTKYVLGLREVLKQHTYFKQFLP